MEFLVVAAGASTDSLPQVAARMMESIHAISEAAAAHTEASGSDTSIG